MKTVKWQHVQETTGKEYSQWARFKAPQDNFGNAIEPIQANQDSLVSTDGMYAVSEATREVQERVQKLVDLSKQILTSQQYNVFILMAVKDPALTEREVAKTLSISPSRAHQLWTAAREKLKRAYDTRTN